MENYSYIIVDSPALSYAAMHTTGSFSYDGRGTGIVFGFLKRILFLAQKFNCNKFIFCWDSLTEIRSRDYPSYKENRRNKIQKMSPEEIKSFKSMISQRVELKHSVLPLLGFRNNRSIPLFEADDLIAAYALKSNVYKPIIATSDNDIYQCLDYADIYHLSQKKVYKAKDFMEEFEISPSQWALAKAIGGCQGDNVKGLKGVSDPKNKNSKAIKYTKGELKKGKILDKIESSKPHIEFFYSLVCLPHPEFKHPLALRRDKITKIKLMKTFFKYGFKSMLEKKNFNQWMETFL